MMKTTMTAIATLGLMAATALAQGRGPTLTWYGRASVKIKTAEGKVIYIDPYQGDYSEPADLILVTHGHGDHNQVGKVAKNPGCLIAAPSGAVSGSYKKLAEGEEFIAAGVKVKAVPAYNKNHRRGDTLGFLLWLGDILVYHAADSSKIPEMKDLAALGISYALLPVDGFYNMGAQEAAECVKLAAVKRGIPIHSSKDKLADAANATSFASLSPGAVVMEVGETIALVP
jgi:L-ascorbate metabolism protein UlaG (beta-lactamase superfamily)